MYYVACYAVAVFLLIEVKICLKKGFLNREMSAFRVMTVDMLSKDPLDVWPPEISILQKMIVVLWL